jgi:AraC-like DNA-binding protein
MPNILPARYRTVRFGVDTVESGIILARHRHRAGYATVVLAGSFVEASFAGRFIATPGDVLLHGAFDCHANRGISRGALQIVRLPWHENLVEGRFRVHDPDALARLSERDPLEGNKQLRLDLIQPPRATLHWTDRLAHTLRSEGRVCLETWAETENLAPETVSRGFRRAYGVAPKVFRMESRARRAWNLIALKPTPFTTIAYDTGFADAAHLTRAIVALTGSPPTYWRAQGLASGLADQVGSS